MTFRFQKPGCFQWPKLAGLVLAGCAGFSSAVDQKPEKGIFRESDGKVVMEVEMTVSPLGKWVKKTDVQDYSGKSHLEFTGNQPASGPPDSPLVYRFRVESDGEYRLYIRARKRLEDQEPDKCNDCYVRLEGDFEQSPEAGDKHGDPARKKDLRTDTKLFGGEADGWGWASLLDLPRHQGKRQAVYLLRAGQIYTLTVSGRSQRFNMDRIELRRKVSEKASGARSL